MAAMASSMVSGGTGGSGGGGGDGGSGPMPKGHVACGGCGVGHQRNVRAASVI